jgi:hypothetical protein
LFKIMVVDAPDHDGSLRKNNLGYRNLSSPLVGAAGIQTPSSHRPVRF